MATNTGKAVVIQSDGTVAFSGLASWTSELQSVQLDHQADVVKIKDATGNDVALVISNETYNISINYIPFSDSATPTLAEAKAQAVLPTPGAAVTLSDFDLSVINDVWTYVGGGTIQYDNQGNPATITLPLTLNVTNDLHTAVS